MRMSFTVLFTLGLLLVLTFSTGQAQDSTPLISYYLATDANGVQQVYQLLLADQSDARQITNAPADVETFGPAPDGLSVAYISDGLLWLQPIHTEEAQALVPINITRYFSSPVFSDDGALIAYADNGAWLLDLAARETRQILADVPVAPDASNAGEYRLYRPEAVLQFTDGRTSKLLLDVGVWEWNSAGLYDLATGILHELEGQIHTSLLPLSDGRVLVYGNSGFSGEGVLRIAPNLDSIAQAEPVLTFATLTEAILFAEQAIEIVPGTIRVVGSAITLNANADDSLYFTFDFDLATNIASEVKLITVTSLSESSYTVSGELSPDGRILPIYLNAEYTEAGRLSGQLRLIDLDTGEALNAPFPVRVGLLHWQ